MQLAQASVTVRGLYCRGECGRKALYSMQSGKVEVPCCGDPVCAKQAEEKAGALLELIKTPPLSRWERIMAWLKRGRAY